MAEKEGVPPHHFNTLMVSCVHRYSVSKLLLVGLGKRHNQRMTSQRERCAVIDNSLGLAGSRHC